MTADEWVKPGPTPWPSYYDTDPRMAWVRELDPRFLAALTAPRGAYVPGPIPQPEHTLGPQWARWMTKNCRMGEGDSYNLPPDIQLFQRAMLWKTGEVERQGGGRLARRFELVLVSMGKGGGKTPFSGWGGTLELAGPAVCCTGTRRLPGPDGDLVERPCTKCVNGIRPDGTPHGVRRESPDVIVMASSFDQADLIFDEMRTSFSGSAPLAEHAREMKGRIELTSARGKARRIPATPKKADGAKGNALFVDEMHEFDTELREKAYDVASGGTAKREDGVTQITSTAGSDLNTIFGRLVKRAMTGGFGHAELCLVMEADEVLAKKPNLTDEEIAEGIRQANPLAACGIANIAKLVNKFKGMPLYRALRYYFNRWVPSDASWLPAGAWDTCKGEVVLDPNLPTWVGADMALKRDSAAVVIVQRLPDNRLQATAKVWFPNGELIDQTECDQYLRDVCATYNVEWVAADEAWWPTLSELERGDEAKGIAPLPIFRMPQQGKHMVVAYSRTYHRITGGGIVHNGQPDFADQIVSAAPYSSDGGWRLRKGKNKRRIDCAPALAGAVFASDLEPPVKEKPKPRAQVF